MQRGKARSKGDERSKFQRSLNNCLLWWGIGAAIGLLFSIALDYEMKKALAEHLETGVSYLNGENTPPITYFLKRCLSYTQLLLFIWGLEYFTYGYLGVRILMLCRGFIYGFSQMAWVVAYGFKGIWLGIMAYWPHNLLFVMAAAWLEWLLQARIFTGRLTSRQTAVLIACIVPILAMVEAYGAPAIFRSFL